MIASATWTLWGQTLFVAEYLWGLEYLWGQTLLVAEFLWGQALLVAGIPVGTGPVLRREA